MNHTTSIGLDVHARSIAAAALDPLTGEVVTKTFAYSPGEVASWALGFDSPKAVYESGVTGFHLCRELNALGLECAVGASSKMQRPPADVKCKNDLSDAQFLARLLATHNVTEVFVPDAETEAEVIEPPSLMEARNDLWKAMRAWCAATTGLEGEELDARAQAEWQAQQIPMDRDEARLTELGYTAQWFEDLARSYGEHAAEAA